MALTNGRCCFNLQLILGHIASLSICLFSTQCLGKHDAALRYPDRRRKQISFPQERESVNGKHIQESQSSPCLPWRPVWDKGVKARSLQSFTAGILACGYSWLPQGSAPCTQLRISCNLSPTLNSRDVQLLTQIWNQTSRFAPSSVITTLIWLQTQP